MKITFVLTLATGRDILYATNILFPSILYFFKISDIDKFLIIMNTKDIELFNYYIGKSGIDTTNLKINIINELSLIDTNGIINTYYLQMYLKLLISQYVETTYYLTLDADCYFCKHCDSSSFFAHKAYYREIQKMDTWNERVNKALDINLTFVSNQTPFVFVTSLVKIMLKELDVKQLILKKLCSEYTLYLGYLFKQDLLDEYYMENNFVCPGITYATCKDITKDNEIILMESFILHDEKVLGCIQSRTNKQFELLDTLSVHIPTITLKKNKIAILTVITDDDYFKKYYEALYTKKVYCKYHNYDFILRKVVSPGECKKKGWLKIIKLLEIIDQYDYVFVSDADVVITNIDVSLYDLIYKYSLDNYMMLITSDHNSINSGNIIWKNCNETKKFLNKILEVYDHDDRYSLNQPYKPMGVYEQPTIIYLINKHPEIKQYINIIPQFEMNSYLPTLPTAQQLNILTNINGIENRCSWEEKDFLIHFAGLNYDDKLFKKFNIESEIKKYILIFKLLIIRKEGSDYGRIK